MKSVLYLLIVVLIYPFSQDNRVFVGSTPADPYVRRFLGIPEKAEVDFIRWKLELNGNSYQLVCAYGIGKPNTNGFMEEQRVGFGGKVEKRDRYFTFYNAERVLSFAELNSHLLHPVDEQKKLLAGNGGFSYTLNSASAASPGEFLWRPEESKVRNRMVFEGRTPCGELAKIIGIDKECYKLKWRIIFYSDSVNGGPSHMEMMATGFRKDGLLKGSWKISKTSDGKTFYHVKPEKYNYQLDLLKADEGVLLFTDGKGKPLIGNADFSYTLNYIKQ